MQDLLDRTATCILYEKQPKAIRAMLLELGLTEVQAYYTYKGAEIIAKTRNEEIMRHRKATVRELRVVTPQVFVPQMPPRNL
jgi:hypothetical protein